MLVHEANDLRAILRESRTIAVVGLSPKPARPSHEVARYLMNHGYTVIPVNPGQREILGQPCYASLDLVPVKVDLVDVFRNADEVMPVAEAAIRIGARCLWLQFGVISHEAAQLASSAGLQVVMDRCTKIDHARLL